MSKRENQKRRFFNLICSTAVLFMMVGCGGASGLDRAAVSGEVVVNGKPIENGSISFLPTGQTKGPSTGCTFSGGRYSIGAGQGPVVGTQRVEIRASRKTGRKVPGRPPGDPPGSMIDETEQYIPAQYNTQSTLTVEIKPGKNEATNFDLDGK